MEVPPRPSREGRRFSSRGPRLLWRENRRRRGVHARRTISPMMPLIMSATPLMTSPMPPLIMSPLLLVMSPMMSIMTSPMTSHLGPCAPVFAIACDVRKLLVVTLNPMAMMLGDAYARVVTRYLKARAGRG